MTVPRGSYDPDSRGPCNDLTFERTTLICVVAVLCVAHLIFLNRFHGTQSNETVLERSLKYQGCNPQLFLEPFPPFDGNLCAFQAMPSLQKSFSKSWELRKTPSS